MNNDNTRIKRGIITSRGIGDILIALPIARHYHEQGEEIVWPICKEFLPIFEPYVDWVKWIGIETDGEGKYFLETPLRVLAEEGVDPEEALYLYQYLSSNPELTDAEMYSILKFDQYKYQVSGVPFYKKWTLSNCITRDHEKEDDLRKQLSLFSYETKPRYAVVHLTGSNARVDKTLVNFLDPAVRIIDIDSIKVDSIFEWILVLQGAEAIVCLDSCIANLVDQLVINGPDLYWIRRSGWDLTPVLGSCWTIVPTNLPCKDAVRIDPAVEAAKKAEAVRPKSNGSLYSHVPFETDKSLFPTSFMSAIKS